MLKTRDDDESREERPSIRLWCRSKLQLPHHLYLDYLLARRSSVTPLWRLGISNKRWALALAALPGSLSVPYLPGWAMLLDA